MWNINKTWEKKKNYETFLISSCWSLVLFQSYTLRVGMNPISFPDLINHNKQTYQNLEMAAEGLKKNHHNYQFSILNVNIGS